MLLLAGISGIAAFFLPFLHLAKFLKLDLFYSGWTVLQAVLDQAGLISSKGGSRLAGFVADQWQSSAELMDYVGFVGMILLLLAPFFLALFSTGYLIKGIKGGSYKTGLIFFLSFSFFIWLSLFMGGQEYHLTINFFKRAGLGYWLAGGSILLAWISGIIGRLSRG